MIWIGTLIAPWIPLYFREFHLNFRNSLVNNGSVQNIVSWAHNLMRVSIKTNSVVISADVINKTLDYIVHPPLHEKEENITFEDFCEAWKKTLFRLFGKRYDSEFSHVMNELRWLNTQIQEAEKNPQEGGFFPTIYLTQTEIDWVTAVRDTVRDYEQTPVPRYPLSREPQKQRLIESCENYQSL